MAGVVSEAGQGLTEVFVASPAKHHTSVLFLARFVRHRADAGFCSQLVLAGKTPRILAELGENLRRIDLASARKGHEDLTRRELRDGLLDLGCQLADLRHER